MAFYENIVIALKYNFKQHIIDVMQNKLFIMPTK